MKVISVNDFFKNVFLLLRLLKASGQPQKVGSWIDISGITADSQLPDTHGDR